MAMCVQLRLVTRGVADTCSNKWRDLGLFNTCMRAKHCQYTVPVQNLQKNSGLQCVLASWYMYELMCYWSSPKASLL